MGVHRLPPIVNLWLRRGYRNEKQGQLHYCGPRTMKATSPVRRYRLLAIAIAVIAVGTIALSKRHHALQPPDRRLHRGEKWRSLAAETVARSVCGLMYLGANEEDAAGYTHVSQVWTWGVGHLGDTVPLLMETLPPGSRVYIRDDLPRWRREDHGADRTIAVVVALPREFASGIGILRFNRGFDYVEHSHLPEEVTDEGFCLIVTTGAEAWERYREKE